MIPFKLESVLKLRAQKEDHEKRELGKLRIEESHLLDAQRQNQAKQNEMLNAYEAAVQYKINVQELMSIRNYLKLLQERNQKIQAQLIQIRKKIHEKQIALHEAMKDRKIMENLKEIKIQEYLEEEKRQEQLLTDELVSYKYSVNERSE